ncbi:hypothetical protein CATMQ487_46580 [Sphaerotilus microaerophilus]|uniref:Uncharacterized protein n=1 Tax=Sphaerotilus microaerophilus TaxID=2914710 RepID=A0ABM7YSV3_9BURK|nr:hypothetical protein CATMQ487_46580 [Sphaerotilus sp. FB-5]
MAASAAWARVGNRVADSGSAVARARLRWDKRREARRQAAVRVDRVERMERILTRGAHAGMASWRARHRSRRIEGARAGHVGIA